MRKKENKSLKFVENIDAQANMNENLNNRPRALVISDIDPFLENGGAKRLLQNLSGISQEYNCDYLFCSNKKHILATNIFEGILSFCYASTILRYSHIRFIHRIMKKNKYKLIFIDRSLYGILPMLIKTFYPECKIVSHFHNFEYEYLLDWFCSLDSLNWYNLISKINLFVYKKSEHMALKWSDKIITISSRDAQNLYNKYKTDNLNYYCVSPAFQDCYQKRCLPEESLHQLNSILNEDYVVFLGSNFYANLDAVNYIINNILPHINKSVVVVGDNLQLDNCPDNICFASYSNVNDLMKNACAFIAPIFSGSGAKIKICEALMYGKFIIATPQAFSGYKIEDADVRVCYDDTQFIDSINQCGKHTVYSEKNRNLFLRLHTYKYSNEEYLKAIKVNTTNVNVYSVKIHCLNFSWMSNTSLKKQVKSLHNIYPNAEILIWNNKTIIDYAEKHCLDNPLEKDAVKSLINNSNKDVLNLILALWILYQIGGICIIDNRILSFRYRVQSFIYKYIQDEISASSLFSYFSDKEKNIFPVVVNLNESSRKAIDNLLESNLIFANKGADFLKRILNKLIMDSSSSIGNN